MDMIQEACKLYMIKFKQENQVSSPIDICKKKLDDDIHRFISIAVKSTSSASNLFINNCVFDSLINALLVCVANEADVTHVTKAYLCLEKYFCLVAQQPWKPEYKTLKTYGGFYKTQIKSILSEAEVIFHTAGYVTAEDNTMVFRRQSVDKRQLLVLSFDCFVASEICGRIAERHNQLRNVGKTLSDAIFDIIQKSLINVVRENSFVKNIPTKVVPPPALPKREPVENSCSNKKAPSKTVIYSKQPSPVYDANIQGQNPEQSFGNFKYKLNNDSHIPFIDEKELYPKLSQATPEEHMRESVKLVDEQQNLNLRRGPSSEEWKYAQDAFSPKSNPDSVTTYPPGHNVSWYRDQFATNMEYLKDEGISNNDGFTKRVGHIPSKSVFSDQGYGTGSGYSTSVLITPGQEMISETIYHPPVIRSDGTITSHTWTKNPAMPPPAIPSRTLKPSFKSAGMAEDVVDGPMLAMHDGKGISQSNKMAIPSANPPAWTSSRASELKIPRSMHQMKSKSLNSNSKKLVSDNRVVKSMDYRFEHWSCPICEESNLYLNSTCGKCSFDHNSSPREPKKSCTFCTYDNDCQSNVCEICGKVLPVELTYRQ